MKRKAHKIIHLDSSLEIGQLSIAGSKLKGCPALRGKRTSLTCSEGGQWEDLDRLLFRDSEYTLTTWKFGNETGKLPLGKFQVDEEIREFLASDSCKILVVGAGGLGCEILKDLALCGFQHISLIDIDTVSVSNLNRQFLFRQSDVGKSKAKAATEFIGQRCTGVNFTVVISGLDNIEARRWLNATLFGLVTLDSRGEVDATTVVPFIDGGTEGLKGQARVILPRLTSCFECTLNMFPPQKVFPLCTIADTPRLPEHCISYAYMLQWPQMFKDKTFDPDKPEHLRWVFERASERADQAGIEGVTYTLTLGVVKNIIPAVTEALKLVSYIGQTLNTYMMYLGQTGVYGQTLNLEKSSECIVCGSCNRWFEVPRSLTLREFIADWLVNSDSIRATKPSITSSRMSLYMQKPPCLMKETEPNLDKPMGELCQDKDELTELHFLYQ